MKKMNKNKMIAVFTCAAIFGSLMVAFQNFTLTEEKKGSLGDKASNVSVDSLAAALQSAEKDHAASQVALNVEPGQVEKTTLKKGRNISTVEVSAEVTAEHDGSNINLGTDEQFVDEKNKLEEIVEDSPFEE